MSGFLEQERDDEPPPRPHPIPGWRRSAADIQLHRLRASKKMRRGSRDSEKSIENDLTGTEYVSTTRMLEEHLQMGRDQKLMHFIKRRLGILSLETIVGREKFRRSDSGFQQPFPCLAAVVQTAVFEMVVGALTVANGIAIGYDASLPEPPEFVRIIEPYFTAIFLVEIGLRLLVFGWVWICETSNVLDVLLLLVSGVLPLWVLKPLGVESRGKHIMQVLRTLRLVRLARLFRTNRFLRTPHKLTQGVINNTFAVLHMYVITGTSIFVFAVFGVHFIGRGRTGWNTQELVYDFFSDVPKAMFTFFQIMTLDTWAGFTRQIMQHNASACAFILLSIMVNTLVLQNLVTAFMVNNAVRKFLEDEELELSQRREEVTRELLVLQEAFYSLDLNGDGELTRDEYLEGVQCNPHLENILRILEVPKGQATDIWELLSEDGQRVDAERFARRMHVISGSARSKDCFSSVCRMRKINRRIDRLKLELSSCRREAEDLRGNVRNMQRELAKAFQEAKQFVELAALCIPRQPAPRKWQQLIDMPTRGLDQPT